MQRGIILLSKPEITIIIDNIQKDKKDKDILFEKFISAFDSNSDKQSQINIQLSEEEVEIVMDLLPPPSMSAHPNLNLLRKNLQEFLMKLRN